MAFLKPISKLDGSARANAFIGDVLSNSPMLNLLDAKSAFEVDTLDYSWQPVAGTASFAARAEGATFSGATATPAAKQTGTMAIYQGGVDVDEARLFDENVTGWFDKQWKANVIATSKAFDVAAFNGDGQTNALSGLKAISELTNLPGFIGNRLVDAANYSGLTTPKLFDMSLTLSASDFEAQSVKFLEMILNESADITGTPIMALNPKSFARMSTIASRLQIKGEDRSLFGVPVETFNNIPMIKMLDTAITLTEPDNTTTPAATTTSIYFLSLGEMLTSFLTNSGFAYKSFDFLEAKQSGRESWMMTGAWKIEDKYSFKRIRNIKV